MDLVTFLKTKQQNREIHFDEVLKIYTFNFLGSEAHRKFVAQTYSDSRFFKYLQERSLLVTTSQDNKRLLEKIIYRYPMYYGRPVTSGYNDIQVKKVMGYFPQSLPEHPDIRYTIVGPALTSRQDRLQDSNGLFNVIHAWGINLESQYTADYSMFIGTDGRLKRDLYKNTVSEVVRMILKSAISSSQGRRAYVRLPLIGLGAFLGACPPQDVPFAQQSFLDAVVKELCYKNIVVILCIFDEHFKRTPHYKQWLENSLTQQALGSNRLLIEKDLFDVSDFSDGTDLYLVNAWDNMSFVGNGGSQDPTIDGFMVAGTGPGKSLPNTSYLHNPFFATSLLDSEKWIRI